MLPAQLVVERDQLLRADWSGNHFGSGRSGWLPSVPLQDELVTLKRKVQYFEIDKGEVAECERAPAEHGNFKRSIRP